MGEIWAKSGQNLGKEMKFGQSQNLTSPKTSDLLRLCSVLEHSVAEQRLIFS